jgi:hypothetical protein
MTKLQETKAVLRAYLRQFSTERVCAALAHAEEGRMEYWDCRHCFVGSLQGFTQEWKISAGGNYRSRDWLVSNAYGRLGDAANLGEGPAIRQRRIIPILRAELRRRERQGLKATQHHDIANGVTVTSGGRDEDA